MSEKTKKRVQWSKVVCVISMAIVVATLGANFVLLWNDKSPMSDVAMTAVSIFGGFVTCGYFTMSAVRDCSKNKHAEKIKYELKE